MMESSTCFPIPDGTMIMEGLPTIHRQIVFRHWMVLVLSQLAVTGMFGACLNFWAACIYRKYMRAMRLMLRQSQTNFKLTYYPPMTDLDSLRGDC